MNADVRQPSGVVEADEEENVRLMVVDVFESVGVGVIVVVVGYAYSVDD